MKSVKSPQFNTFFIKASKLEYHFNEQLGRLLFGSAAEHDYEDVPLPSERRKDKPRADESTHRKNRKKSLQLHLLFIRKLKRKAYQMVLHYEQSKQDQKLKNGMVNSYR